ncbi:2-deoxy-D-gluconate 3-dehydrogenase [Aestuarium zhoushanense]|nr:2-deoxy-D-gluconate 3-dehydrogenase [Aestuarium zhoushanense]
MLKGRKALVTGASSGLGAHFAQVLAAQGAEVTLGARRLAELQGVCEKITNIGGRAKAVRLDVTDAASVAEVCAEPFDIVVNNAGISAAGPAMDYSEAEWDRTMDINLKGAFLVSQAAAQKMKDNGGGSIINIASILGLRVAGTVAAYATSKAALVQMTKATALEWARYGIRVNALCPGYIETPLNTDFFATDAGQALIKRIPQRRLGRLQDLDGPLLLLASDAGAYMTGSEIAVDGGHLVSSL